MFEQNMNVRQYRVMFPMGNDINQIMEVGRLSLK